MKKTTFSLLLSLLTLGSVFSQVKEAITIDNFTRDSIALSNNKSFQAGEYLKYDAKIGIVKGGEATLTTGIQEIGDSYFYHFRAVGKDAGFAGKFYFIEDIYDSYVNIINGLPIKAVRDIKEENYRKYNELLFDRTKNEIISTNKGIIKARPNIVDILSSFYYARRFLLSHIQKNQEIILNTFFEDKFFAVKLKYKKKEKIKTKFGKISCIKLVPVIEKGSVFEKEKHFQLWVTDDDAHILIKLKAKAAVGTAIITLQDYKNIVKTSVLYKE